MCNSWHFEILATTFQRQTWRETFKGREGERKSVARPSTVLHTALNLSAGEAAGKSEFSRRQARQKSLGRPLFLIGVTGIEECPLKNMVGRCSACVCLFVYGRVNVCLWPRMWAYKEFLCSVCLCVCVCVCRPKLRLLPVPRLSWVCLWYCRNVLENVCQSACACVLVCTCVCVCGIMSICVLSQLCPSFPTFWANSWHFSCFKLLLGPNWLETFRHFVHWKINRKFSHPLKLLVGRIRQAKSFLNLVLEI